MVSFALFCHSLFQYKNDKEKSPEYLPTDQLALKDKLKSMSSDYAGSDFVKIFPSECQSFFQRCANKDPEKRPNPSELLQNTWVNDKYVRGIYNLNEYNRLIKSHNKSRKTHLIKNEKI